MRLFKLFIIPVIVLTGSVAQAQEYSARPAHTHPRVSTEFASLEPAPAATPAIVPVQVAIPTPVNLAPARDIIGYENPQPVVPAYNQGVMQSNGMATFGTPGCDACGRQGCGCSDCGGSCHDRLKAWLCFLPQKTCKKVCYNPIPQLYLFFPCSRPGYHPILAPYEPCRCTCDLHHIVAPPCKSCCGSKGSCDNCQASSCGTGKPCGEPLACGSCASCGGSGPRIRGLLKPSDGCCATSAVSCPPITAGSISAASSTGGCTPGLVP